MDKIRALIMDDSSVMRKIVERSLRRAAIELERVIEASNGAEALAALQSNVAELVLCDINMPDSQWTSAWGINNSGEVTVQWGDQNGFFWASLYNGSTFTSLTAPGGYNTGVHSINTAGDIMFVWGDPYGNNHAALLNAGSYFVFDMPASLGSGTDADGLNDSGAIVGHFTPTGTSVFGAYEGKL